MSESMRISLKEKSLGNGVSSALKGNVEIIVLVQFCLFGGFFPFFFFVKKNSAVKCLYSVITEFRAAEGVKLDPPQQGRWWQHPDLSAVLCKGH